MTLYKLPPSAAAGMALATRPRRLPLLALLLLLVAAAVAVANAHREAQTTAAAARTRFAASIEPFLADAAETYMRTLAARVAASGNSTHRVSLSLSVCVCVSRTCAVNVQAHAGLCAPRMFA
jgi:hypothetical protein